MAEANTSILVFVSAMAVLFALLYVSQATEMGLTNEPRVVHAVTSNSSLGSLCLSLEDYESLFDNDGPVVGLPTYIPQGYSLQCINVSGPYPSDEDAVTFLYLKDDQEFQSRFLPEIERETQTPPYYAKWTTEFHDAGGILVYRAIEYIEKDDPRYNDKVKHVEIERAVGHTQNDCSLPEFTRGSCEPLEVEYSAIKFANGNPIVPTFRTDQNGSRTDGLLMYMDHNWLVHIAGLLDPDELYKIAETIQQIDISDMNAAPSTEQLTKYEGLSDEQIRLVKMSARECDSKVAVLRLSEGEKAAKSLESTCEDQESTHIARFVSSTPVRESMSVVNGTVGVSAGQYLLYPVTIPPDSTGVTLDGSYTSEGSGIGLLALDETEFGLWKNGEYPVLEPLWGAGVGFAFDAVAGKTIYLIIDNTADSSHDKQVDAQLTFSYVRYIPK